MSTQSDFFDAVLSGNIPLTRVMLATGAAWDMTDRYGNTALDKLLSVHPVDLKMLSFAIESGVDINMGKVPPVLNIMYNVSALVRSLKSNKGETYDSYYQAITMLINAGADTDTIERNILEDAYNIRLRPEVIEKFNTILSNCHNYNVSENTAFQADFEYPV